MKLLGLIIANNGLISGRTSIQKHNKKANGVGSAEIPIYHQAYVKMVLFIIKEHTNFKLHVDSTDLV